ncbi:antitoxin Xre/MbcA/ParS toxin-binding domain-containing protein [Gemmatimonas sp.]|uniref:antitoxin Xre/MbcA/ParS toxin-binding domain-containing protein n=1 Tax=Gemmatimonas sp. TaxID=1962908 RepID=UPI00391F221B
MATPPASRKAAVKRASAPKTLTIVRGSPGMGKQEVVYRHLSKKAPRLRMLLGLEPMARIDLVRAGVDPVVVDDLDTTLGVGKERLLKGLGVAPQTVSRNRRLQTPLNAADSERVVGLAQLLERVARWTPSDEAAAAGFDPFAWLGTWLTSPNPALGGQRPLALLDTSDGRLLVDGVLATMESGAYV